MTPSAAETISSRSAGDDLLVRWGAWSWHNISIGYPSKNIIYRMMQESSGASYTPRSAGIPASDEIQQVDAIIAGFRNSIKKALKVYYILQKPPVFAAKMCRCSEDELMSRINFAIDYISAEMGL